MKNVPDYIYQLVRNEASRNGIDPAVILAQIDKESSFNANAINPSDPSYGLMQVTLPTAREVSGDPSLTIAQLMIPDKNIEIGVRYLALKINEYSGNIRDGLAAYNSGKARLKNGQYVNTKGITNVNDYVEYITLHIPEYQAYVKSKEQAAGYDYKAVSPLDNKKWYIAGLIIVALFIYNAID